MHPTSSPFAVFTTQTHTHFLIPVVKRPSMSCARKHSKCSSVSRTGSRPAQVKPNHPAPIPLVLSPASQPSDSSRPIHRVFVPGRASALARSCSIASVGSVDQFDMRRTDLKTHLAGGSQRYLRPHLPRCCFQPASRAIYLACAGRVCMRSDLPGPGLDYLALLVGHAHEPSAVNVVQFPPKLGRGTTFEQDQPVNLISGLSPAVRTFVPGRQESRPRPGLAIHRPDAVFDSGPCDVRDRLQFPAYLPAKYMPI
jgi:hypothetical protein